MAVVEMSHFRKTWWGRQLGRDHKEITVGPGIDELMHRIGRGDFAGSGVTDDHLQVVRIAGVDS